MAEYVYHATPTGNVDQIMREGLRPQVGEFTRTYWPQAQTPYIHACEDTDTLADVFGEGLYQQYGPVEILKVPGKYFQQYEPEGFDPNTDNFDKAYDGSGREPLSWWSDQHIPPHEIERTGLVWPDPEMWVEEDGRDHHDFPRQSSQQMVRAIMKYSMAQQTGDPLIDEVIQRFMAGESELCPEGVDFLRDPDQAYQMCSDLSEAFTEFASKRLPTNYEVTQSEPGHFTEFGYHDAPVQGFPNHEVTYIEDPQGTFYMIDFTASQYGYQEMPMVQRKNWDEHFTTPNEGWTR